MESFQRTVNLDINHQPGENPARGLQGINPLWESGTQNSGFLLLKSPHLIAADAAQLCGSTCLSHPIVFYESQNLQGRSYNCKGDSADLFSFISRCNSVKVQGGW
ncbi:hypothetical protein ATANTOWER_014880 [Ataeniobius toweri]|uniref:Beta/gamma crystallin 'Greek key' domain-containing protein n=1 Tax=Ataeniobius toweri TaxID=208326 RepID=A0ABU7AFE5_9TELE|nr:hypothetical protein [Ataeniobius toweri]